MVIAATVKRLVGFALALSLGACTSSASDTQSEKRSTSAPALDRSVATSLAQPVAAPSSAAANSAAVAVTTADTAPKDPQPTRPATIADLVASSIPIVLAHAGGEDQHPHSTPYAFSESVNAGVDMLDLDVQLSADGVLVVQHDDTVDRTTNGVGLVAEMTYAQIATLDNAYWFTVDCTCRDQPAEAYILRGMLTGDVAPLPGYSPDDFIVPRFRDIMDKYPLLPLNIEIKGSGDLAVGAARVLANELAEFDATDRAVVSSFDDSVISAFHDMAPTIELSPGLQAATAWVLDSTPLPTGMRILQLPPEFNRIQVLTAETIEKSHAAGYVIWVWPNDRIRWESPAGYAELLAMGMDGLNINFPHDGVAAVAAFSTK